MEMGLQTYSVRNEMVESIAETLETIRNIGYQYIELPQLYDRKASDLKSLSDNIGLSAVSVMFFLEDFADNLSQVISDCKELRSRYAVCLYTAEEYRTDDGYLKVANILEQAAQQLNSHGITLAYHNHEFEFDVLESGTCGHDILVSATKVLTFELDVGWVQFAGIDPTAKMAELGKRLSLIHLRDMNGKQDRTSCECELGSGVIDLSPIIKAADKAGIEFAFVEHGNNWIDNDPIKSAQKSASWLHSHSS